MWRIALIAIVLAASSSAGAATELRDARVPAAAASRQISAVPQLQTALVAAINALRASKGLGRLHQNEALTSTSLAHSVSMAEYGYFAHEDRDGAAFWERIRARYRPGRTAAWEVGENLLWTSSDVSASQALDMWLQSPPHRRTLLSPDWRDVGVGAVSVQAAPGVYNGLDVTIVTADFGVR